MAPPRTRNGAPVVKKEKAAAARKTAKQAPKKRAPKKQAPKADVSDENKEPRLNMVERVRVAERIAAARTKPKPDTWQAISKREGLHIRTCQRVFERYRDDMANLSDTSGVPVLTETLLLYTQTIEKLSEIVEYGDSDGVKVGAARAMLDALKGRIELLAVMGRMPRSFRAMDELAMIQRLLRKMVEVIEKHELAPEVVADFVGLADELSPVIEQSPRRALQMVN